jgi:RpiR family transcriptional regulator, carbohydrate utilization regulator
VTAAVVARIQTLLPTLQPSERRVAEVFLARPGWTTEASSSDVAAVAGVSRATVVRACQRLGFTGYPQLRVLLARDLGIDRGPERVAGSGEEPPEGAFRAFYRTVADSLDVMTALLDDASVDRAVTLLCGARRILVAGTGLSAPVAAEAAMRLTAVGRPADAPPDHLTQQIRARLLGPDDACLVVSGTGSTDTSLRVAEAAAAAGAPVVALTAFARSALAELATVTLVSALRQTPFSDEITRSLRVPQTLLVNALVYAVAARDPDAAAATRARLLEVVGEPLAEDGRGPLSIPPPPVRRHAVRHRSHGDGGPT